MEREIGTSYPTSSASAVSRAPNMVHRNAIAARRRSARYRLAPPRWPVADQGRAAVAYCVREEMSLPELPWSAALPILHQLQAHRHTAGSNLGGGFARHGAARIRPRLLSLSSQQACQSDPSCRQSHIQFLHDDLEILPKHLRRTRQASFVRERRQVEAVHVDLQTRRDVVAHHPEPLNLLVREYPPVVRLLGQPLLKLLAHAIRVWDKLSVLVEGKTYERHDVGQEPLRRRTVHLGLLEGFVGAPQLLRCP